MKKLRAATGMLALAGLLVASTVGTAAYAAPSPNSKHAQTPPATNNISGAQATLPFEPGTKDAPVEESKGPTQEVRVKADGKPQTAASEFSAQAGVVAGVDFQTPLNYCYKDLSYLPVKNTTTVTKYLKVRVYNQGSYRELYTSVAANSTAYPAFYGISGTYSAYLYVWNGSTYQYDEYKAGENTCNVVVSRTYNTGGWVQLKIENKGTSYATQKSSELAPYPGSGTYTGTHYDYPAAGGAAIYRWFQVGTSPYGIVSSTTGSSNTPYLFSGDQ